MSRKITSFCVVLLISLTSVFAAQRCLNSISELIEVHQGEHTNILALLRWFANTVDICNGDIELTFDPNSDYGSHHYGNYEDLLDAPPWGFIYYTVGNIHQDTSESLPPDVRNAQRSTKGWNTARIIFSASSRSQINRVFITQHYGSSDDTRYNPPYTFEVTINLLQEFRRQRTDGHQRGNYGNSSNLQGLGYTYQQCATSQRYTRNDEMDCLSKFCIALGVIIVFFALIGIPTLANMGK